MKNDPIVFQAKIYGFDLDNCAREFGFKPEETWELSLASNEEKSALEKLYFPIISAKILPEMLSEMFSLVSQKLNRVTDATEKSPDIIAIRRQNKEYLMAFNPMRMRN
ncbi:MAG TPA: hypothetical protein VK671_10790 [Mucilaginibacter sp.]|nr:hypothetical protein [Mucilaginibacter sp.]